MILSFKNKKITGILSILPANEVAFEEEMHNYDFSPKQSLRLKSVLGFGKHRIVKGPACVSDLAVEGFSYLFKNDLIQKEDLDAVILLTNTPDFIFPPTSNIIQSKLGLKKDTICLDINQGCAGFMVGLMQAFMILEQPSVKKVAVVTADVISRKSSIKDRNFYPLLGDSAAITIVENAPSDDIHLFLKMDGDGANAIIIPAGGMRIPYSAETELLIKDEAGNTRNQNHIYMDGTEVYNFVMHEVPPMFSELFDKYGMTFSQVDYFMCHQPNRFMLERLADKIKVPYEHMPNNLVENYGNSASSTIPNVIVLNLGDKLEIETKKMCLAGFGVGLVWSSTIMKLGNLDFCRKIDVDL
jgi:3-oxoacyl-[acyl-carrier-protein] synthase-3